MKPSSDFWFLAGLALIILCMGGCDRETPLINIETKCQCKP